MQDPPPVVTASIDIAVPPRAVWRVLTDFSGYTAWHPVLSLEGAAPELTPGACLAFRLSGGPDGDQVFTAELTDVAPPRLLAWNGGVPDVFYGRHTFELLPLPGNGTRFTDTESWTGTMVPSVIPGRLTALERRYARSAAALKQRAEHELRR